MRAEIVSIGTELLIGQIVDTNSTWLGEQLAANGIDCNYQTRVGDNIGRVVQALRIALSRNEAVITTGGLGPTQDDLTREAIAELLGVALVRDEETVARIGAMFAARGREMPESNLRQADVPMGAELITQVRGTAPGLICPVGKKVLYAVPGVPYEMREMFERAIKPDLHRRAAALGSEGVLVSRVLRTWGMSEAGLGEKLAPRFDELSLRRASLGDDAGVSGAVSIPTIAFLASGIEGLKVRVTAKAQTEELALGAVLEEQAEIVRLLGDVVFTIDDETMEAVIARHLTARRLTLAVAESLTGGLAASRLVSVPGASDWFRGGVVAYHTELKRSLLGVPDGIAAVSEECARAMAEGARRELGATIGIAMTGVAGPTEQDGQPVGTVFVGLAGVPASQGSPAGEGSTEVIELHLPGDRERIREYATISAFDLLRRRLGPGGAL